MSSRLFISAVTALCLTGSGCSENKSEEPSPGPTSQKQPAPQKSEGEKPGGQTPADKGKGTESGQQQTPATTGSPDGKSADNKKNVPPPSEPVPNKKTIASVLAPDDEILVGLSRLFMVDHPNEIEQARDRVVDEVFADESQAQGKIIEIQASIGKLANNDLYSPEAKNRVSFLQSGIRDRIVADQYYDVLEKGALFIGTGAVLGTLAGTSAYRYLPDAGAGIKKGYQNTETAVRAKFNDVYARGRDAYRDVRGTLADRQRFNAAIGTAKTAMIRARDDLAVAARRPFRSAEELVRENLQDFGVTFTESTALTNLKPVLTVELPHNTSFLPTPKSTFHYAVLDRWEGQDLGIERVLVFKQQRLIRGSPIETNFATPPIPADVAGQIAGRMQFHNVITPDRQFVHFVNLKTGAVSALRWTGEKYNRLMSAASATVRPLFMTMDVPTALGTGALTTAALGVTYWYGYDKGQNNAAQMDVIDLESMVHPRGAIVSEAK